MSKQEIYWSPLGEMIDMISCIAIYEGNAKQKRKKRKISFEELLNME